MNLWETSTGKSEWWACRKVVVKHSINSNPEQHQNDNFMWHQFHGSLLLYPPFECIWGIRWLSHSLHRSWDSKINFLVLLSYFICSTMRGKLWSKMSPVQLSKGPRVPPYGQKIQPVYEKYIYCVLEVFMLQMCFLLLDAIYKIYIPEILKLINNKNHKYLIVGLTKLCVIWFLTHPYSNILLIHAYWHRDGWKST